MADAQQSAKQYKDAAATYLIVINEKALPDRIEEASERRLTALHLSGDYAESDKAALAFRDAYPKSLLLPAVLFRHAENAYFSMLAAEKLPNPQDRAREVARWNDEALKRYQFVVERFPESGHAGLAG